MDKFRIVGGKKLAGSVKVSGAKNAVLPILASSPLLDGRLEINNAPYLTDISTLMRILGEVGVHADRDRSGRVWAEVKDPRPSVAPYELVRTMRASFNLLGPLWARRGYAKVSLPGGCNIGHRPVDLHIKGLKALGARIRIQGGYVVAEGEPRGARIYMGGAFGSTVLGTCNVVSAAVLAKGETIIEGAAMEPEVQELCKFLKACGAEIEGIGSHRLRINGVKELKAVSWNVITDRIEAGTLIVAGLITNSQIEIRDLNPEHLSAVLDRIEAMGASLEIGEDSIITLPHERLRAIDLTTHSYPGFPTDLQAQFMALLSISDGISVITERIYPERFIHAAELGRMGAHIRREGSSAVIQGVEKLSGAPVMASDLRASAALLLAGLVAEGITVVDRVYHIDRGYERIEEKLRSLGADVERIQE